MAITWFKTLYSDSVTSGIVLAKQSLAVDSSTSHFAVSFLCFMVVEHFVDSLFVSGAVKQSAFDSVLGNGSIGFRQLRFLYQPIQLNLADFLFFFVVQVLILQR